MTSILTKDDKIQISQVVMDNETGHHLLIRRSPEYYAMRKEWAEAVHTSELDAKLTERQKAILAYAKSCEEPPY